MGNATADHRARQAGNHRHAQVIPLLLLLATALLRVAWLARFPADPIGTVDAEGYHLLARNLLRGHGFALRWETPFCPTALRTPLYPLFLAGVYRMWGLDPARGVLAQILLEVLTTACVMRLGYEVRGRRLGTLAGLLYVCNGSTQRYTGLLFAEALLLPVLTAALCVTIQALQSPKRRYAILAGALWALALLTKPNVQYLALTAGLLFTVSSDEALAPYLTKNSVSSRSPVSRVTCHVSRGFPFYLALLALLLPWLIRNHVVVERWTLSTAFEENLARVSAVATLAEARGQQVEPWTASWEVLYGELVERTAQRYAWDRREIERFPCVEQRQRHREVAIVARDVLQAHPWKAVGAHLQGVLSSVLDPGHRTWYPALTGQPWETTGVISNVWRRAGASLRIGAVGDALHALWLERVARPPWNAALIWWGLLTARVTVWILGERGLRRLFQQHRTGAVLLASTVAYHLLLPGPIAYDRFYLPAIPTVVILVATGLITQSDKAHTYLRRARPQFAIPECESAALPFPYPR